MKKIDKKLIETINRYTASGIEQQVDYEKQEYTYGEYAKLLNIGRATVARYIKKLNGTVIQRIGSNKDGHWEFIK